MLTTYEYDTQGRVVRAFTASPWTEEDRALMLAWAAYQRSLCPRCGHPKETAWHPDNEGYFEVLETHECNACTAIARHGNDDQPPVEFLVVSDTRDYDQDPLPPMPVGPRMSPAELAEAMGGAA